MSFFIDDYKENDSVIRMITELVEVNSESNIVKIEQHDDAITILKKI